MTTGESEFARMETSTIFCEISTKLNADSQDLFSEIILHRNGKLSNIKKVPLSKVSILKHLHQMICSKKMLSWKSFSRSSLGTVKVRVFLKMFLNSLNSKDCNKHVSAF